MLTVGQRSKALKVVNSQPDDILFDIEDNTFYDFSKLCYIIYYYGTDVFVKYLEDDSVNIKHCKKWLGNPQIHLSLRRLKCQGMLSKAQWDLLYPFDKDSVIFPPRDIGLLLLILKYTGLITPPKPNGWLGELASADESKGAQLAKFQSIRKMMANVKKLDFTKIEEIMATLKSIYCHFGKDDIIETLENFMKIDISESDAIHIVERFKLWHKQEERIFDLEQNIEVARANRLMEIPILQKPISIRDPSVILKEPKRSFYRTSYYNLRENSRNWQRWSEVKVGIQEEEKDILRQFYSRLITEVRPDSMIDQLLSKKVLTVEESGEVFSSLKSSEQMALLLDVLVTKTGQAFTEFLNALKIRYLNLYTDLYEEYQKLKQEVLANKPEGVSYCNSYLASRYKLLYNSWNPILWYPDATVSLEKFYCNLHLLDSNGLQIDPIKILSNKPQNVLPRAVVIEGEAGTGKSFLSHYLASRWSNNCDLFEAQNSIKVLLRLDLKLGSHNLRSMLIDQLFSDDMKLSDRELWEVIERNQQVCMFILDGYNGNVNEEILKLIVGEIFPKCYLVVFSDSASTSTLTGHYDEKLVLTGFMPGEAVTFTKNYVKLSRRPMEHFENLLHKLSKSYLKNRAPIPPIIDEKNNSSVAINRGELPPLTSRTSLVSSSNITPIINIESLMSSKQRAGSVVPGLLMGFSRPDVTKLSKFLPDLNSNIEETEEDVISEVATEDLSSYQERQKALRFYSQFPLYCGFFCIMTDVKLGIDLTSWSALLEHFFTAIKVKLIEREKEGRTAITKLFNGLLEVAFECMKQGLATTFVKENERINKFGVLRKVLSSNSSFSSKFFFPNDIIVSFLAAKCLDFNGLEETNNYFQNMTLNKSMYNLIIFYCGIRKNDRDTSSLRTLFRKIVDVNTLIMSNETDTGISNGANVMKFQFSLDCVAAMEGRNDLLQKVGETLPSKIKIEHSCIIPMLTLQGLSFIISFSCENIREIDIRLNYLSRQTPDGFQILANAIHENKSIKILRIYWEQLELMSLFFSTICEKNQSISTIECYDESSHKYENFTSRVAHNIRIGCRNMKNIKSFAFIGCTFSSLTHAVIRNLCENLELLDLSGCSFTIISCNDLAEKIIHSKCLKVLKLANAEMQSMAFNTFIRSFTNNRTVTELTLNGIKMDNVCFFSLAESLKLNNRLEKLFLLNVIINERSCDELATVLKINTTLKELHITDEKVSTVGKKNIKKYAKNTKIIGIIKEKPKTIDNDKDGDLFNF